MQNIFIVPAMQNLYFGKGARAEEGTKIGHGRVAEIEPKYWPGTIKTILRSLHRNAAAIY